MRLLVRMSIPQRLKLKCTTSTTRRHILYSHRRSYTTPPCSSSPRDIRLICVRNRMCVMALRTVVIDTPPCHADPSGILAQRGAVLQRRSSESDRYSDGPVE
jgi:hypothetical protein